MHIKLEFDMYEDREEFEMAYKGADYHSALMGLDEYLRGRLKYEDLNANVNAALQATRDKLRELMQDAGGLIG